MRPSSGNSAVNEARRALAAAHRIAVFSGAGLSAESGIATFRGNEPDSLWSQFNPMELASVDGFLDNPERVVEWYNWRRAKLANARPNPAHVALAKHPELIQITQNVDDLLERAGVAASAVLPLHGTITVYPAAGLIEIAAAAGSKIISINTERSSSFGGEHIELLGAASVLLPELLEGLRVS